MLEVISFILNLFCIVYMFCEINNLNDNLINLKCDVEKNKISQNEKMDELIENYNELKNENDELKKKFNELKNENNELRDEIDLSVKSIHNKNIRFDMNSKYTSQNKKLKNMQNEINELYKLFDQLDGEVANLVN